jgi:hypothetical protein
MKSLKEMWAESQNYTDSLVKKYPALVWEKDAVEISGVPAGWRTIVDDLFGVLNEISTDGVYIHSRRNRFVVFITTGWNRLARFLRLPAFLRFSPRLCLKNHTEKIYPKIKILQVKEKFAGLRLYYSCLEPNVQFFIDGAIEMADTFCRRTCQISGAQGKERSDGWIKVLSDEEYLKRKKRKMNSDNKLDGKTELEKSLAQYSNENPKCDVKKQERYAQSQHDLCCEHHGIEPG